MKTISSIAVLALVSSSTARHHKHKHHEDSFARVFKKVFEKNEALQTEADSIPACTSFECKTETAAPHKPPKKAQYPMNYFVPNFGPDHDIANTMKHTEDLEKKYGPWNIDLKKKEEPPRNYFVPNFGVDRDIKDSLNHLKQQENVHGEWHLPEEDLQIGSDPICDSSGCNQYKHPKEKDAYPVDYPVPNFGMDEDIADSQRHEAAAENEIGHSWMPEKDPETEKWVVPTATVEFELLQSDPICDSSGCNQYQHPKKDKHPMDYFVPNFGVDQEIADSQKHEKEAESTLGHQWAPKIDPETEKFVVPTATPEFKLAQLSSDPICASSGCPETKKKKGEEDVVYPMYPQDHDIDHTQQHLKEAESKLGKWDIPKFEDVQLSSDPACTSVECEVRHSNPSKPGDPVFYVDHTAELDDDIVDTNKHMHVAEQTLGPFDYMRYIS